MKEHKCKKCGYISKLKKIWLNSMSGPAGGVDEIRVDWDNDRHQAISLENIDPDGVIDGLRRLIYMLESERSGGKLCNLYKKICGIKE